MREQTVQAGDTYVVEAVDLVAVELGRQRGFFGDGQVARAGAGDNDASVTGRGGLPPTRASWAFGTYPRSIPLSRSSEVRVAFSASKRVTRMRS